MRGKLFGLLVACPFDQSNPFHCRLYEIRKKSLKERYDWFAELSEENMLDLLVCHQRCLGGREASKEKEASE